MGPQWVGWNNPRRKPIDFRPFFGARSKRAFFFRVAYYWVSLHIFLWRMTIAFESNGEIFDPLLAVLETNVPRQELTLCSLAGKATIWTDMMQRHMSSTQNFQVQLVGEASLKHFFWWDIWKFHPFNNLKTFISWSFVHNQEKEISCQYTSRMTNHVSNIMNNILKFVFHDPK